MNIDVTTLLAAGSTAISATALIFVARTLRAQTRQVAVSQAQTQLTTHMELIRMAIERPELRHVFGSTVMEPSSESWPREAYRNLIFQYALMGLKIGVRMPRGLAASMSRLFTAEGALVWWEKSRKHYLADADTSVEQQFIMIVDQAWRAVQKEQSVMPGDDS